VSPEILFSILALLVLLSGFFSSSETAMMSLNRYRLKHMKKKGHKGALRATKLLERPDRLIGLILIGNNLINIAASALATVLALKLYGEAGVVIATLILTFIILIFAEVTPKTIAAYHPERVAFPASIVLKPLMTLLYPVVWVVNHMSNAIVRLFGINPAKYNEQSLSGEELRSIVGDAGSRIPQQHQGMLLNILDLEHMDVDDILVPRNEIVGIDLNNSDEEIAELITSSDYTRLPVYREHINSIEGTFHLRHSALAFKDGTFDRETLTDLLSEPYFIPENTPLNVQLANFQKKKNRIGIVVDEYGDVMGLVALEDILEEIVGDFTSNIAETIEEILPQKDGSFMIEGTTGVRDINKALDWELPTEGPRTLNGLLIEHLESFPDASCGVEIGKYQFEIIDAADKKIEVARAILKGQSTNAMA
jgi:Mg2+/Co2+ transporter CorB